MVGTRSSTNTAHAKEVESDFCTTLYRQIASQIKNLTTNTKFQVCKNLCILRLYKFAKQVDEKQKKGDPERWSDYVHYLAINPIHHNVSGPDLTALLQWAVENEQTSSRLYDLVEEVGLDLVIACSHSKDFNMLLHGQSMKGKYKGLNWTDCVRLIKANQTSLELFFTTRGMNLGDREVDSDRKLEHFMRQCSGLINADFPNMKIFSRNLGIDEQWRWYRLDFMDVDHPHPWEWAITEEADGVERCMLIDDVQENVDESVEAGGFEWPKRVEWPFDDPRYCHMADDRYRECANCAFVNTEEDNQACACTFGEFSDKQRAENFIELRKMPSKGVGVRNLAQVKSKGVYLGEYVGEMYPYKKTSPDPDGSDPVALYGKIEGGQSYRMISPIYSRERKPKVKKPAAKKRKSAPVAKAGKPKKKKRSKSEGAKADDDDDDDDGGDDEDNTSDPKPLDDNEYNTFVIDAAHCGNWTRFVNHSCKPNCRFEETNIGQRHRVIITSTRAIPFGEELTVNYGSDGKDDDFFKTLACACGWEGCKKWKIADKNDTTLKEAIAKGDKDLPDWAKDKKFTPWK